MSKNPVVFDEGSTDKAVNAKHLSGDVLVADISEFKTFQLLLLRENDKKTLESSLLISLLIFIALTFVVFPEIVSQTSDSRQKMEVPDYVQWPTPTEEKPPESTIKERVKRRPFEPLPEIKPLAGNQAIIEVPTTENLEIVQESVLMPAYGVPSTPPGPVEVAGNVIAPTVTFPAVQPFPQKATILRRNGRVKVRLIIRKNGEFEILKIMEENPPDFGFGEAAKQYLLQSIWKPALQNGRPIDVFYEITIVFALRS